MYLTFYLSLSDSIHNKLIMNENMGCNMYLARLLIFFVFLTVYSFQTYANGMVIETGDLVDNFEGSFSHFNGGGTYETSYDTFIEGSGSLQLSADNGSGIQVYKSFSLDMSDKSIISLAVYVPTKEIAESFNNSSSLILGLHQNHTYYQQDSYVLLTKYVELDYGWNHIVHHVQDDSSDGVYPNGNFSWDSPITGLTVRFISKVDGATVYIDDLRTEVYSPTSVMFRLDDGHRSVYSIAKPIFDQYEIKPAIAVVKNYVGVDNNMSIEEIDELHSNGWPIINHSESHYNLAKLDNEADIFSQIENNQTFIRENGWEDPDFKVIAFPNGAFNDKVIGVLNRLDYHVKWATKGIHLSPLYAEHDDYWTTFSIDEYTTLEEAVAFLDKAVLRGQSVCFLGHSFTNEDDFTKYETTASMLSELLSYISTLEQLGLLKTASPDKYYKSLWPDTDKDGISDRDEINIYYTDPFLPDTDGDNLTDGEEIKIHKTNPLSSDTDNDTFWDNVELTLKMDPNLFNEPGDFNNDNIVDFSDMKIIHSGLHSVLFEPSDPRDINHDGIIDRRDQRELWLNLCTRRYCRR